MIPIFREAAIGLAATSSDTNSSGGVAVKYVLQTRKKMV
jgi:hypothetical protein